MTRKSRNRNKRRKKEKSRKFSRTIIGLGLLGGFVLIVAVFFNPWVWRLNLRAELERSKFASTVYDRNGDPIVSLYAKSRLWASADTIPLQLQQAYVATEDARFYLHKGIDFRGILRALYQDVKTGRKAQGGSTITQQLVKNLFFSHEKNVVRKIGEMAYAIRIEQQYNKKQILELYLNSIYLGHGAWGVEAASRVYFGKPVRELNINQSALLAALARSPEYYSPFRNPAAALKRRNLVLQLMHKYEYLTAEQLRIYRAKPLEVLNAPGTTYVGAYFVDYVIDFLTRQTKFSEQYLRTAGLKVYTTMDRRIQRAAEQVFNNLPFASRDQWGVMQPQGALVALNPQNSAILALVGGRRFSGAEVNRSYQIHRQPGSAIKPFVYAAALENGYTAESQMEDKPLQLWINGKAWEPQNYDNQYRGWVNLQTALEESINTISIQLVQAMGVRKVFTLARRMGLESLVEDSPRNDLGLAPLALGGLTKGVSLLELTGAYSAFVNQGVFSRPFGVLSVYDHNGRLIYRGKVRQEQVIQPETADELTVMMEGVIARGTGKRARLDNPAAGKTGTTNGNTNGWFVGYTPELLAGVWIGNDLANRPLLVKGVPLGSGTAAELWGNFMRQAL
ncbi:MAG TPA: PBP1A family penicillin-binding protein [Bacillota bacterium]|nr:PBP1A family penicillin-binding protein [Bacillota bacterium]